MNKRLVWNFEINTAESLLIEATTMSDSTEMTWESRFFWHEHDIIILNGLSQAFLDLSHYQIKHKADEYYLLPHMPYNLKVRRNQLYYKPLIVRTPCAFAYGKKINLHEQKPDMRLAGTDNLDVKNILAQIYNQSRHVLIEKETLSYQFKTTPTTQLELSRIYLADTVYFSVCIESSSRSLVESITTQLLHNCIANDYVSFLQHALI